MTPTQSPPRARMPAEWEPHAATWLGWPHPASNDWQGKLQAVQWVFAEFMRRLTPHERVRLLVAGPRQAEEARRVLVAAEVDLAQVDCIECPTDRCWTRDMGPLFVKTPDGGKSIAELHFNGWGGRCRMHARDAQVARRMAQWAKRPLREGWIGQGGARRPLVLEGGAVDVDGAGTLLTTEECLLDRRVQVRNRGFDRPDVEAALGETLGARHVIWLGHGIAGDDTHGHVDDICRFTGPGRIVAVREQDAHDENYAALEENWERLQDARLADGSRPETIALPMPGRLRYQGRRLPASYANFYIANGVVLVPTFNDPADRTALGLLQECFPGRTVVGIHALDLLPGGGSIHCLTQQEPA